MLRNAECLPIEHIDRIQITLNPLLYPFINFENIHIDPKKHLRLWYNNYYGGWWYLDIQAQHIYQQNIRASIARAISTFIIKGAITLSLLQKAHSLKSAPDCSYEMYIEQFVYRNLEYFVYEVREIEFYFDFEPHTIQMIQPEAFIPYENTLYPPDYRPNKGRPKRKSLCKIYNRIPRLKAVNQMRHTIIEQNTYSQRCEFLLNKYNCPYLSLNSLEGTYHEVMVRYIPYLAVLYNRFLDKKIAIDTTNHPYFSAIVTSAQSGRRRYTGDLKIQKKPQNDDRLKFWRMCGDYAVLISPEIKYIKSYCDSYNTFLTEDKIKFFYDTLVLKQDKIMIALTS